MFVVAFVALSLLSSCSISKPCSDAGDTSWVPQIIGDKSCAQKTQEDGTVVNDGGFRQIYQETRTVALVGAFKNGKKHGIWQYYDPQGKLLSLKYFDRGIETSAPASSQKEIDRLIEQHRSLK